MTTNKLKAVQASGKGAPPVDPDDALTTNVIRLEFYLDKYRFMQKVLAVSLALTCFLSYALYDVYSNPPAPRYIAAEKDGRIIPLIPLNRPTLSKNALLAWSAEAVTSIYTWDYVNYRKQFSANTDYFSDDGWTAFLDKLDKSGTLATVKAKSMLVSGVVVGSAVIVDEGLIPGENVFRWIVEVPMDVTYTPFGQEPIKQRLIVTLTLKAVSPLVRPRAIAIVGLSSAER